MACGDDLLLQIADEGGVALRVDFGDGIGCPCAVARGGFRWPGGHAAAFRRFFASMARTNLSHFAIPARFSAM